MKIAIIGAGIAGNTVARQLYAEHDVTVFEAGARIGGHSHTHRVEHAGRSYAIDTGFIVYNTRNYPEFSGMLNMLGVESQPSTMSFSVRDERSGLEYSGTNLNTFFAQRRNLLNPAFLRMLREIMRFNARAPGLLVADVAEVSLGAYLQREGYSQHFIDQFIIPMGAAIWSTRPGLMLQFPAQFFVRFLHNHGMLSAGKHPEWRSIVGGSMQYVERLVAPFRSRIRLNAPVEHLRREVNGVWLSAGGVGPVRYDAIFLACHSDQALKLLAQPTAQECEVLGAIPFQRNDAVLHRDASLLPRTRRAWAAWNYHVTADRDGPVQLTYNMNLLQRLESSSPFLVTLNRSDAIDPALVIARETYHHPLFSPASTRAQLRHRELNGYRGTYYCGAWWRNGFHEDGVASALQAVAHFRQDHAQRNLFRAG
jgi:predicted NAD/FAD-binding protein